MTKLALTALIETKPGNLHRCSTVSEIKIKLGNDIIAEGRTAFGGVYSEVQALRAFRDDYRASLGKLDHFKYTFRGNTLRGMIKHLVS